MVPQMGTKFLPGSRLPFFPSADEIAEALENIVPNPLTTEPAAESVSVAVEPVVAAAEPVAVAVEPVVAAAESVSVAAEPVVAAVPSQSSDEEDEEMDFDMEWD